MQSLSTWIVENGGIINGLTAKKSPGKGKGLFYSAQQKDSSREKDEHEKILAEIPRDCCVNANSILDAFDSKELSAYKPILVEFFMFELELTERISIILLLFLSLSKISKRFPGLRKYTHYLKQLPEKDSMNNLLAWNEYEVELLAGTPLYGALKSKQNRLETEISVIFYAGFLKPFADALKLSEEEFAESFNLLDFIYCDSLYWSRVVSIATGKDGRPDFNGERWINIDNHLVPVFDFANHSNEANIRWEADEQSLLILPGEGTSVEDGDELFLCYGKDKSNTEFMFSHGFYLSDNEMNDCFAFPLFIDQKDPLAEYKIAEIKKQKLSPMIQIVRRNLEKFIESKRIRDLLGTKGLNALKISNSKSIDELEVIERLPINKDEIVRSIRHACINQACLLQKLPEMMSQENISYSRLEMARNYRHSLQNLVNLILEHTIKY